MPIKIPGESSNLPTSADVKFVQSNGNEKTVQVIKRSKSSSETVVWEKQGFAFNVYVCDVTDRTYTGSQILKLLSSLKITITRNGVTKFDGYPTGAWGSSSYYYSVSCGILPGDTIRVQATGKDWMGVRHLMLSAFNDNSQILFNNYGYDVTTSTDSGTITVANNINEGPVRLEVCLVKKPGVYQLNSGVVQADWDGVWFSEQAYLWVSNSLPSTSCFYNNAAGLKLYSAWQWNGKSSTKVSEGFSGNSFSHKDTGDKFRDDSDIIAYYQIAVAPKDNFIDWNAANVYWYNGWFYRGTHRQINGNWESYMYWGDTYDGRLTGGGGQQT